MAATRARRRTGAINEQQSASQTCLPTARRRSGALQCAPGRKVNRSSRWRVRETPDSKVHDSDELDRSGERSAWLIADFPTRSGNPTSMDGRIAPRHRVRRPSRTPRDSVGWSVARRSHFEVLRRIRNPERERGAGRPTRTARTGTVGLSARDLRKREAGPSLSLGVRSSAGGP